MRSTSTSGRLRLSGGWWRESATTWYLVAFSVSLWHSTPNPRSLVVSRAPQGHFIFLSGKARKEKLVAQCSKVIEDNDSSSPATHMRGLLHGIIFL
jgi:hypothetical protein